MFDEKGFEIFVGHASGASYTSGLTNIEKTYSVNIDNEYAGDKCAHLCTIMDADKKALSGNDLKTRQNWYSHLKKYIAYQECVQAIDFVLTHYKAEFPKHQPEEQYKWEAVLWYKNHWNIDAPDFAAMFKEAFAKASKLLDNAQFSRPYTQACEFVDKNPEVLRSAFRNLYDETQPLESRIDAFRNVFENWRKDVLARDPDRTQALTNFQDLHTISVYLSFEYPENYYIYKSTCYRDFAKRTNFEGTSLSKNKNIKKLEDLTQLCALILQEINKDNELLDLHNARLDSSCYRDANLHLLATDVIFYCSKTMPEHLFRTDDNFWPSKEEYNPGITEEMWTLILQDESIATEDVLKLLNLVLKLGGECNFQDIATHLGKDFDYDRILKDFSAAVVKKCNCPPCPKDYKDFEKYIIPFVVHMVMTGKKKQESWRLRDELKAALMEIDPSIVSIPITEEEETMETVTDIGLNTILYGPPGTGKTYHTVIYAVAIIENKKLETVEQEAAKSYQAVLDRYNEYKAQRRIEFTTFHQSYGYEEFIEGIRPSVNNEDAEENAGNIQYSIQPGMFKRFCERAERPISHQTNADDFGIAENATIWKVSLGGAGENEIRTDCLKNGYIRIGWEKQDVDADGSRIMNALINRMQIGDIVFSCYSTSTIDAIGVVTGEYEQREEYEDYRSFRTVNWLVKDFEEDIRAINGGKYMMQPTVYRLRNVSLSDAYRLIEKHQSAEPTAVQNKQNYVFIIDEINRGNISKIFGELISLIEDTKRVGMPEGMTALLPYSMNTFGVPDNVYIVGTMNTADRSIATIDTALRRRFQFREMLPDEKVVAGISVDTLSIGNMLKIMNQRVAVLYDREHTIGHAYFMKLKEDNRMEVLADIFMNKIIPLLQEYFYEDYDKIRLVLGDNQKKDETTQFIQRNPIQQNDLFGNAEMDLDGLCTYTINDAAFMNPEAYRYL